MFIKTYWIKFYSWFNFLKKIYILKFIKWVNQNVSNLLENIFQYFCKWNNLYNIFTHGIFTTKSPSYKRKNEKHSHFPLEKLNPAINFGSGSGK